VEEAQSAFIQGRSILHNVMIGEDLTQPYGRKSASPQCIMKIDEEKAY